MAYKKKTVSLDESIIKDIKLLTIETDKTQKELINEMLRDGVKRTRENIQANRG